MADLKRFIEKLEPSESAKPLYKLSATHSITDKALRANLRLGELFTQTGSIEDAAEQYCDRVENWNEKVKKWNSAKKKAVDRRRDMFVSSELESFARKVKELRSDRLLMSRKVKQSAKYRQNRLSAQRLLKKFDKVVRNVANGQFPGKY